MHTRMFAAALAIGGILSASAKQVGHAQPAPSRSLVEQAAKALGGIDRIRAVKNITLHGYAQYAYQMGGGRISGGPEAPEKYIAANDLTRVYDLENGRFQMRERRNMLVPFLAPFGHSFAVNDNRVLPSHFSDDTLDPDLSLLRFRGEFVDP